jgi:hypothetical protein
MTEKPADIVRQMAAQLAYYDFLLPGDYVPDVPVRKRWFRWRPSFEVTQDMIEWAGAMARARSLMDLKNAANLIDEASQP